MTLESWDRAFDGKPHVRRIYKGAPGAGIRSTVMSNMDRTGFTFLGRLCLRVKAVYSAPEGYRFPGVAGFTNRKAGDFITFHFGMAMERPGSIIRGWENSLL